MALIINTMTGETTLAIPKQPRIKAEICTVDQFPQTEEHDCDWTIAAGVEGEGDSEVIAGMMM